MELLQPITAEILVYEKLIKPVEMESSICICYLHQKNQPELIMPYATF